MRRSGGKCRKHGGGTRCQVIGCDRSSQGGGKCRVHADNGSRCQVEGCETLSQSGGKCIKHGGGRRVRWREDWNRKIPTCQISLYAITIMMPAAETR